MVDIYQLFLKLTGTQNSHNPEFNTRNYELREICEHRSLIPLVSYKNQIPDGQEFVLFQAIIWITKGILEIIN